jgi:hypothetical protein
MKTREPWWRTIAKMLFVVCGLYLLGAGVLFFAAITTGQWIYWATGLLLLIGAVGTGRVAWDIRR